MRLFEFAPHLLLEREETKARDAIATVRFADHYPTFVHKYRELPAKLRDFLLFRQTARPDQPFNAKDGQMVGVRWLRRCHLIHGKALILYMLTKDSIELVDIVEHDEIEGRSTNILNRYVAGLTPQSFKPFEQQSNEKAVPQTLSNDQKEKLITLFKMMATEPSDRPILDAATRGDLSGFLEWARYALGFNDASHDKMIVQGLGGKNTVMKWAKMWLAKA